MKKTIALILALLCILLAFAEQPHRGYRGFVDWSNNIFHEDSYDGYYNYNPTWWYTGVSTTHGYQFNPWLFAGVGLGLQNSKSHDSYLVPVFAAVRSDLKFGRFTPFAELRGGYNLTNDGGYMFAPTIGYRFNWGRRIGLNAALGLTVQDYKYTVYQLVTSPEGYLTAEPFFDTHRAKTMFTFRIGLDF